MIEFRINAEPIELNKDTDIAFKWENNALKLNTYSFGRSISFNIPKTPNNERILGNESNIYFGGAFSRSNFSCQMMYSGGTIDGKLLVNSYSNKSYSACFIFENNNLKEFLESKIVNYLPASDTSLASAGEEKVANVAFGFIKYKSKQNGNALLDPNFHEIKMLHSVMGFYIFTNLRINFDNTVAGWETPFYRDHILCGSLKPLPSSQHIGSFGGDNIPLPLAPYVEITNETGAKVPTARIGGFPKHLIQGKVTLQRCFVAKSDIVLKFPSDLPNGLLMLERGGKWLSAGTDAQGNEQIAHIEYTAGTGNYYIRIKAGQEFAVNEGERFIILNGNYWDTDFHFLKTSRLSAYNIQAFNAVNITVAYSDNDSVEYGELVDVAGSLPELTVYQFINIFSLINGRTPIFSATGNFGRSVDFWDWSKNLRSAIALDDKVISVNKIERKFEPVSTNNNFKFGEKIESAYFSENTTLGDFDIIDSKLRMSELDGSFDDYSEEKLTKDSFIGYWELTGDVAMTRKKITINQNLKNIIENSTMVEVTLNYPLFRSLRLNEKQTFLLNGQTYFCLSANFSEKTATMQLVMC